MCGTLSCDTVLVSLSQGRTEPWGGGAAGKKNRRKKPRASYDNYGMDPELLPPSKRVLSLRMQQSSRPDSANSDDGRSVQPATRHWRQRPALWGDRDSISGNAPGAVTSHRCSAARSGPAELLVRRLVWLLPAAAEVRRTLAGVAWRSAWRPLAGGTTSAGGSPGSTMTRTTRSLCASGDENLHPPFSPPPRVRNMQVTITAMRGKPALSTVPCRPAAICGIRFCPCGCIGLPAMHHNNSGRHRCAEAGECP